MRFVDTNVLLYAISKDSVEADKAALAEALLSERDLALSVQVLQEFYVQATRPARVDRITHDQAVRLVTSFTRFPIAATTVDLVNAALGTAARFGVSYWDAAIIAAGLELGCTELLSEDLNDGQDYGGIVVTNPFRDLG